MVQCSCVHSKTCSDWANYVRASQNELTGHWSCSELSATTLDHQSNSAAVGVWLRRHSFTTQQVFCSPTWPHLSQQCGVLCAITIAQARVVDDDCQWHKLEMPTNGECHTLIGQDSIQLQLLFIQTNFLCWKFEAGSSDNNGAVTASAWIWTSTYSTSKALHLHYGTCHGAVQKLGEPNRTQILESFESNI